MSGITRRTKTRVFGSRDQHKREEEDNTYFPLEILHGDCDYEKKWMEEEFEKDEPIWKIEKIIAELMEILKANGLPSDPYARYYSEEYAKDPEAYEAKHKNNRFGLSGHTWNLQAQIEGMTESYLCRESASALLLAVTLKHRILDGIFDDTSTNYALDLALIMSRLKMLEMEHEAAAGKKRMDGVNDAIKTKIARKKEWHEIAFKEFESLSKEGTQKETIYRRISETLSDRGFKIAPNTIKKAIIKNQSTAK